MEGRNERGTNVERENMNINKQCEEQAIKDQIRREETGRACRKQIWREQAYRERTWR
jgi:hypothetical protein